MERKWKPVHPACGFSSKGAYLTHRIILVGSRLRDFAADLAVGWGPMSDQAILDQMSISQGQRWYTWRPEHQRLPLSNDEIVSHSANIQAIPSSHGAAVIVEAIAGRGKSQ